MRFNPEYDPDTYSVANGQIMADFAVAQGRMPRAEAEAWMRDLQRLGSQGRYFFSLNRYLFLATKRSQHVVGRTGSLDAQRAIDASRLVEVTAPTRSGMRAPCSFGRCSRSQLSTRHCVWTHDGGRAGEHLRASA